MVKSQINSKSNKNKSFSNNKKFTNEPEEKPERKHSNISKSEDELLDESDNSFDKKAEKNLNKKTRKENKEKEEEEEEDKKEDLFNEENAKKYEDENLILETPLQNLRKMKTEKKAKGFRTFNLSQEIYEGIKRMGYKMPTPIQRKCVPQIMSGFNVIAHSRTGSGKTAAFVLPILHRLKEHSKIVGCRCLIICPTRELAHQTMTFCKKLGKFTNLKYALLVGGNELEGQFERLAQNPDIIIATPGRIVHHLSEGSLSLKRVEILAIDEADKLFELNFEEQLTTILRSCPPGRQVLLFSATIPAQLAQFMKTGIREYKLINIEEESKIPDRLKIHMVHSISDDKKYALVVILKQIIKQNQSTLVFVPTKYHCEFLHEFLKYWNINTLYIFGQMDQQLRDDNLEKFRKRRISILLVTDVAARGLDIPVLDNVVNFDFPDNEKLFIHRVGRTARAGKEGRVISLLAPADLAYFFDIKYALGRKLITSYQDPEQKEVKYSKAILAKALNDFDTISLGSIPSNILSGIKESARIFLNSRTDIETIEESSVKAYNKMLLFRQKPTGFGVKQAKKVGYIDIHPFFINEKTVSQEELEKQNLLNQLKNFKPKESYFERTNETNVNDTIIKEFKSKADEFKKKKTLEKKKEKLLWQQYQDQVEDDLQSYSDSESNSEENNSSDEDAKSAGAGANTDHENQNNKDKKNKKQPIQVVNFQEYKQTLIQKGENTETNNGDVKLLGRKVKRSQIRNFRNNPHFVSDNKDAHQGANKKSLWGDEKPITLDELTLNLLPDNDDGSNTKKKMVWDNKKKNFIKAKVDSKGNIIKKNEAGVKIKKDDKTPSQFKKWKKKNRTSIQRVGEMENETNVMNAQSRFKDRKMNKMNKSGNNNKKIGEAKTAQQILKGKKEKFKFEQRRNYSKRDFKSRQINEKSHLNRKSFALVKRRKK